MVPKPAAFTGCQLVKVRSAKEHADTIVVEIDSCNDRHMAELLKSARIFIARSSFSLLPPVLTSFIWVDLMGLAVVNREGVALGLVKDLISTGPQTVMVIEAERDGKTEYDIPFVSVYVDDVSLETSPSPWTGSWIILTSHTVAGCASRVSAGLVCH